MKRGMAALLLLLSSGCGQRFWYTDDIDVFFDFFGDPLEMALGAESDLLETPYVRGTTVTIFAHTRRDGRFEDWSMRTSDSLVFQVVGSTWLGEDSDGILAVDIVTTGEGVADLELIDDRGDVRDTVPVEVAFPDRIELHAAGALFANDDALDTLSTQPQVLVGTMATFQVRYFDGDTRLSGHQVLSVDAIGAVTPVVEHTWFSENRDWLQVTPVSAGPQDLDLLVDGQVVETVTIEGVGPEVIDHVGLFGGDDGRGEEDQWFVVVAQAFDAEDEPVYGVEYTWDVNGVDEPGLGDLYRYEFDDSAEDDVTATFGDHEGSAVVHAGEGYVDSSNDVGCATTSGSPAAALLALLLLRRRPISAVGSS